MKHEECMETDEEYARTYNIMLDTGISFEKIVEVVVKSNCLVGVGIVSFKDGVDNQLNKLARGY